MRGTEQGAVVAGQGRLRGQRVHRLRARDARHQFHGEAAQLPVADQLDQRRFLVGIDEADQDRAVLHRADHFGGRRIDRQHDVGV
jgi:hypothetical protein